MKYYIWEQIGDGVARIDHPTTETDIIEAMKWGRGIDGLELTTLEFVDDEDEDEDNR